MSNEQGGEFRKVYTDIGIDCVTAVIDGGEIGLITLLLPTETSEIDGEYEEVSMTIAAAKTLLIDLREAIEAYMENRGINASE